MMNIDKEETIRKNYNNILPYYLVIKKGNVADKGILIQSHATILRDISGLSITTHPPNWK